MLRLARIVKNYQEAGALNGQVNLYGFVSDHVFLTKSGELGVILEMHGVDYECLDGPSIDGLTKRLESAFRLFDENYRIYQYLFKRSNPGIPYQLYGKPIVDAAILNRIGYLASKSDKLYSLSLYYVIFFARLANRANHWQCARPSSRAAIRSAGRIARMVLDAETCRARGSRTYASRIDPAAKDAQLSSADQ